MVRMPASCIWSHPAGVTQSTFSERKKTRLEVSVPYCSWEITEIACVHPTAHTQSPAFKLQLVEPLAQHRSSHQCRFWNQSVGSLHRSS